MGGVVKGVGNAVGGVASAPSNPAQPTNVQIATLQAQVAHLTKLVHILWGEAQTVASVLHIDHQGVHISVGAAHLKVLRHGEIVLDAPKMKGHGGGSLNAANTMKGNSEARSA